jgi:hypothetical protein
MLFEQPPFPGKLDRMKTPKNMLILSSGGMILSAFYGCSSFIFAAISQKPIPLSDAGIILFIATLITSIHSQRGWRRIYVIGLHTLGLMVAILRLCHNYYGFESSFWLFQWVQEFLMLERPAAGWFVLILILICIFILWFCGIRLVTRPTDQTTISHRFDIGLGFLLLLLVIKLLIATKGVSIPVEHSATRPTISFIILGLFSLGIVRSSSPSQVGGISYFKGAGIAMSFTFIILILGGGLFILFLPEFQNLAETSADLLKNLKKPLERFVIFMSSVYLESGFRRKSAPQLTGDYLPTIDKSGGELGILHYLFIGITIVILLSVAGFILYRLIKWLLSETVEERDKRGIWELLLSCIIAATRILSTLWNRIFYLPDTSSTAEKFYRRLLRWGRISGLRHAVFETHREYGIRLGHLFPQIEKEIRLIVNLHDEAVYGGISPDNHKISRARLAFRRLRNPLLWFTRIKSLLFLKYSADERIR